MQLLDFLMVVVIPRKEIMFLVLFLELKFLTEPMTMFPKLSQEHSRILGRKVDNHCLAYFSLTTPTTTSNIQQQHPPPQSLP